jgi:blue copper oxidase
MNMHLITMRTLRIIVLCTFLFTGEVFSQNLLYIPDTLSGTVFNLSAQAGTKQFIGSNNTPTYGYNGNFLGPTLLINKGDSITLNVTNNLTQETTVHWHGFHVAPQNDGGPHQIIMPGATWSPSFTMRNEAATFWYHPHGEGKTEIQISKGLAGMIIVRDSTEASYTLPRTYGIDDFPLIVQSKAFDVLYQFATATHEDSVNMVNGTIDPYLPVPQQVVRLRLLNASADRTYNFGLSNNANFYLIASDGGLLSQPYLTNRVRLSTGERAEILVNLSSYSIGTQLYLKSYASELPRGIIGADSVGTSTIVISEGYYSNPLNGADFDVLRLDIIAPTANPVTNIPAAFAPKVPLSASDSWITRSVHFSPDTITSGQQGYVDGPFMMNDTPFHMDSINIVTYLDSTEIWTLTNSTMVAHPFHIHDIEFFVLDINGNPPPPEYQGLKDVILVQPNDTVRFITKFITFSDPVVPYMFHCHLLHHEDDGMMGTFLVIDAATIGITEAGVTAGHLSVYPNPASEYVTLAWADLKAEELVIYNTFGQMVMIKKIDGTEPDLTVRTSGLAAGIYYLSITGDGKSAKKKFVISK